MACAALVTGALTGHAERMRLCQGPWGEEIVTPCRVEYEDQCAEYEAGVGGNKPTPPIAEAALRFANLHAHAATLMVGSLVTWPALPGRPATNPSRSLLPGRALRHSRTETTGARPQRAGFAVHA